MLTLDVVPETDEPNVECKIIEDTMRITNNTPFRETSSGFRITGFSGLDKEKLSPNNINEK
jgi:hypothetical protein